jgi:hypothetical protein
MRRWVSEAKRLISAMSFAFGISRLIIPRLEIGLEKRKGSYGEYP